MIDNGWTKENDELQKQNKELIDVLDSFYYRCQVQEQMKDKIDFGDQYCEYHSIMDKIRI